MMTHLAVPGVWYMRGPPESPAQGSCHSPLLNSTSVPNIFLCLYFVWETLRLTLLSSLLCCRVQRSCLLSVVNLWTGIILGTLSFHSISLLKSSLPIWISLNSIGLRCRIISIIFLFLWQHSMQWLPLVQHWTLTLPGGDLNFSF